MTLREYFLKGYNGDENDVFLTDEEMIEAESWDAEIFANYMFHKNLNQVKKKTVYKGFRYMVSKQEFLYELEQDPSNIVDNILLLEGGSKKLELRYNDNFDLTHSEEEN